MRFGLTEASVAAKARRWLKRVIDQPRFDRNQVEQLKAAFQQQFERPFQP